MTEFETIRAAVKSMQNCLCREGLAFTCNSCRAEESALAALATVEERLADEKERHEHQIREYQNKFESRGGFIRHQQSEIERLCTRLAEADGLIAEAAKQAERLLCNKSVQRWLASAQHGVDVEHGELAKGIAALDAKLAAHGKPAEKQGDAFFDLWRCSSCGNSQVDSSDPRWRWTGEAWEHKCGDPQAGYFPARNFGKPSNDRARAQMKNASVIPAAYDALVLDHPSLCPNCANPPHEGECRRTPHHSADEPLPPREVAECGCAARKILQDMLNSLKRIEGLATIDIVLAYVPELRIRKALAAPCNCAELRKENDRLKGLLSARWGEAVADRDQIRAELANAKEALAHEIEVSEVDDAVIGKLRADLAAAQATIKERTKWANCGGVPAGKTCNFESGHAIFGPFVTIGDKTYCEFHRGKMDLAAAMYREKCAVEALRIAGPLLRTANSIMFKHSKRHILELPCYCDTPQLHTGKCVHVRDTCQKVTYECTEIATIVAAFDAREGKR